MKIKEIVAPVLCSVLLNGAVMSTSAQAGVIGGIGIIAASQAADDNAKALGSLAGFLVVGGGVAFGASYLALVTTIDTPAAILGSTIIVLDDKSVNEISANLPFLKPAEVGELKDLINSKLVDFDVNDDITVEVSTDEVLDIMEKGDYSEAQLDAAVEFLSK